ncbi:site-specific integrase [Anaerocolumna sp. AGMB13025]|uniref:tyrosine-type recombinase/integrase n=1 Tax=Anaerocolumna sp. AGMB13025 TaxID=3039116 RepID=UPI00241DF875|nr:site-specific integrase [Anaerocolumna sp. AGMB13025]WFR58257.1 site-specific integrase [Anaerocolumna sp. AGMB13025]
MIAVIEQKKNGNTFYLRRIFDHNNTLINEEKVRYKTVIKKIDNKTYFILYDMNMCIIKDVFKLLNIDLSEQAYNSKEKNLHGLKLLFIFSYIINTEISDFKSSDINNFINFLQGKSLKGRQLSLQLTTERNSETISSYLSSCRIYAEKYCDKTTSKLLELDKYKTIEHTLSDEYTHKTIPYKNRIKKHDELLDEVPAYINTEEMSRIINIIRSEYSLLEECIVRLMFETGLRIGEVLGLTADDLVVKEVETEHGVNYITYAYIRNRVSDENYQKAKTCMKVHDVGEYQLKSYQDSYQVVIVPRELFELINSYIEKYHLKYRKTKKVNYYHHAKADRVRSASKYEDMNYYVFLNSQGKKLSQRMWSSTLREIFIKADIAVDKEKKIHNLSHRFRHGFAVFHVQHMNTKILKLKELMRHRSIRTLERYYKLTLSDKVKIKEDFTDELYRFLPELKTYNYNTKEGKP